MDKPRILSGEELVARGTTKIDGTLPEVGLKDVIPNGSWLEEKQIQSALEARKQLIEIERIEKCGTLSHAEWREDLMLAEVAKKVGGHWQYVGYNVGKQLYLKPEEALFLMEVNSLQLKHNDITVSLQQAYTLLLRSQISHIQYKVYASLSRMGYKVFRHEMNEPTTDHEKKLNLTLHAMKTGKDKKSEDSTGIEKEVSEKEINKEAVVSSDGILSETMETDDTETHSDFILQESNSTLIENVATNESIENQENISKSQEIKENINNSSDNLDLINKESILEVQDNLTKPDNHLDNISNTGLSLKGTDTGNETADETKANITSNCESTEVKSNSIESMEVDSSDVNLEETSDNKPANIIHNKVTANCGGENNERPLVRRLSKLQMLQQRKLKPCDAKKLHKSFEIVPEIAKKQVITINVPDESDIPKNIFLNNTTYFLNIQKIRTKSKKLRPPSNDSGTYNDDNVEVSGANVRRLGDVTPNTRPGPNWNSSFSNTRFTNFNPQMRPFRFWRQTSINYFQFNLRTCLFQRPFLPSINFVPRLNPFPRPPQLVNIESNRNTNNSNQTPNRKRRRCNNAKQYHLSAIKGLAGRLKQLLRSRNTQEQNVASLQKLIQTYNTRYKERVQLTDSFQIVNNETIVETIDLDDEDESSTKRSRSDSSNDKYNENFNKLKQLAMKLKELVAQDSANARHRRAFSNVVKRFNRSYNADIVVNINYEVSDEKRINIDSSTDSDCVVEVKPKAPNRKKLKNPFNILKRLSEKSNASIAIPTTSKEDTELVENREYSQDLLNRFKKWLPSEDDFGRVEVVPNHYNTLTDNKREQYIIEFIKNQPNFKNWFEIKMAFLKTMAVEETIQVVEKQLTEDTTTSAGLKSLIDPDDCTDMPSILKKLSVIQTYKASGESNLCIDFDVYNRDVQNFKKSNRPKPHFRVICVSESSMFPCGDEVAALHSKYKDGVAILFAVVGIGSISYLQINPADLPFYIPKNE